jgi:hypothetical protein
MVSNRSHSELFLFLQFVEGHTPMEELKKALSDVKSVCYHILETFETEAAVYSEVDNMAE